MSLNVYLKKIYRRNLKNHVFFFSVLLFNFARFGLLYAHFWYLFTTFFITDILSAQVKQHLESLWVPLFSPPCLPNLCGQDPREGVRGTFVLSDSFK